MPQPVATMNLECGDSSPLSLPATGFGELERADKSERGKAAASCRSPKNCAEVPEKTTALFKGRGRPRDEVGAPRSAGRGGEGFACPGIFERPAS